MNKFGKLTIFSVALIASGIVYQNFYRPKEVAPVAASGKTVEINMRVVENTWEWTPKTISAGAGDRIVLKIFNEDSYDHGFALEAFGINKRLLPKRETVIEFDASKAGKFNFYCSVPCGEGHYTQTGEFESKPAIEKPQEQEGELIVN